MISYQLAYLKAHYPAYFMAELFSSVSNQQNKIRAYVKEATELNIKILPPSINHSLIKFTVEEQNQIRMGLTVIKGVGVQAVEEILKARGNRPFDHLFDFCRRVSLKIVNRSVIEVLILAGAFDETYTNRATLLASIDQAIEQGELFSEFDNQTSLFEGGLELDVTYTETEPFSQLKALAFEKEVLGMYLSSHPLATYREKLRLNDYLSLNQLKKWQGKSNLQGCAVIQEVKTIRTKRGDPMAFVTFGDETEEMEAVIFPDLYRQVNRWLKEEMIILFKGKLEDRNQKTQWLLNDIRPFNQEELNGQPDHRLYVKLNQSEEGEQLSKIKILAQKFPGTTPVVVYSPKRKETYQLSYHYYLNTSKDVLKELSSFFGEEHVVLKKEKKANANN